MERKKLVAFGSIFAFALANLLAFSTMPQGAAADGSASAFAVPQVSGVEAPIWLVTDGLEPGDTTTISLTTATGEVCDAVNVRTDADTFTVDFLSVAQATVGPASCSIGTGDVDRYLL